MTVRKRTYKSKNSYQNVYKGLLLDVERVAIVGNPLLGNITVDTNKPWVGIIDSGDGTFEILQTNSSFLPLRYLEGNFFDIFIQGEVSVEGDKTRIDVKFKLGWFYVLVFFITLIATSTIAIELISQKDWDSISKLSLSLFPFIIIPSVLLIVQLNRVGDNVSDLLSAER
jgi:hypothetical protein